MKEPPPVRSVAGHVREYDSCAGSNTASSPVVLGTQIYGPYGNKRTSAGTIGTAKGYTGQYNDDVTGLDYYNARYYDPVVGRFLSADSVQGNLSGMDPYGYVANNPETNVDPTGFYEEQRNFMAGIDHFLRR